MKNKSYSGKELCQMAEKSDKISRFSLTGGSHRKYYPVYKEHPPMVIPYHNKTMGKGICSKVLKWFKLIGVMTILGGIIWIGNLFLY